MTAPKRYAPVVVKPLMIDCTAYGFSASLATLERLDKALSKPGALVGEIRPHVLELHGA